MLWPPSATGGFLAFARARSHTVSSESGLSWLRIACVVRSWSLKPRSWYRTFLEESRGIIVLDGREIPVRAVFTRSERLKTAVDRAYREKYNTPGSLHYVRGFAHKKRRDTTTELLPGEVQLLGVRRPGGALA